MGVCDYKVWNGEELEKCGKETEISTRVVVDRKERFTYLCSEHKAFVEDSVRPKAIQTSQGLMHIKTIKEMFKEPSKKKRKCPECGYVF